jgi:hypothetical protein
MRKAQERTNGLEGRLAKLQRSSLEQAAKAVGLDLTKYEAGAGKRLAALRDLVSDLVAERDARAPDMEPALKSLVPRSRRIGREMGWVAYKPDPFGPPEVVTEGPYLDPGVPLPTVPVCSVVNTTILDTSANQGLSLQVVAGSDSAVSMTEAFDPTPGLNEGRFTFGVFGSGILQVQDMLLSAGFRFNFFPPQDGEYLVRPVAILNGAWQLLASSEPIFSTGTSIEVAFRTRVSQSLDDANPIYFYHDVQLVDAAAAGNDEGGSFFYQTATAEDSGAALGSLVRDTRAHVVVGCAVRVKTIGPSAAFLDVDRPKLFMRVPEVHVDQLDCSGRVAVGRGPREDVKQPPPDLPPRPGEGPPTPGGGSPPRSRR